MESSRVSERIAQQKIKMTWKNPRHFFVSLVGLKRGFSTASTFELTGVQKQSEAALLQVRVERTVRRFV
ncbi:MAG: hypothetical protein Q8K52_10410 [Thiobacillus sp.]|nr:hypothetical protein [Thiobacillus sp.]